MLGAPALQFAGDRRRIGTPIRLVVRQDVPDDHQQLAGNRHNGFAFAQGRDQPCELGMPVGMVADGACAAQPDGRLRFRLVTSVSV